MSNIKIYFGTYVDGATWIDIILIDYLIDHNNDIDKAVECLINDLEPGVYHTWNPLIPNFCTDEVGAELFWIVDKEGNHIQFKEDKHLMDKLEWCSVGDALCDDHRVFPQEIDND